MRSSTGTGTPYKKIVTTRGNRYEYWAVQVVVNGKRKTLTAMTRAAVVALRDGTASKAVVALPSLTLGAFLREWIDGERGSVAFNTWRAWENHVRNHLIPHLGSIGLRDLTARDVEAYMASRTDLDRLTVNHHRSTLVQALEAARKGKKVTENVALDADPLKVRKRERKVLTPAQLHELVSGTSEDRLAALWAVLATTGLRISEALGLRWEDLDLEGGMLHVREVLGREDGEWTFDLPKTDRSIRDVPLAQTTIATLRRHRLRQIEERLRAGKPGDDGLVFVTTKGQPIHASNATAMLRPHLRRLGLPDVVAHSLRHSVGTELTAKGLPIALVSKWLGHSSSRVTEQVYGHLGGEDLRAGADLMERMVR